MLNCHRLGLSVKPYLLVNFFVGEAETQAVIWGSIDQGEAEWRQEQPKHKRKPTHL